MDDEARSVLITGASAGIGRACAEALHAAGWAVTGASRRGRVDALVAAAGWGLAGAVEQCPVAEAQAQLETNFWGCVRVVQQVLPAMRARGGGRIVLVSSIGGLIGVPFQAF